MTSAELVKQILQRFQLAANDDRLCKPIFLHNVPNFLMQEYDKVCFKGSAASVQPRVTDLTTS